MDDISRIRDALARIPPDIDREQWARLGMAVKSELGDSGFEVWSAWSRGAASYNAKDARDTWKSIKPGGGVGIGTLFHVAKEHGWQRGNFPRKLMGGFVRQVLFCSGWLAWSVPRQSIPCRILRPEKHLQIEPLAKVPEREVAGFPQNRENRFFEVSGRILLLTVGDTQSSPKDRR